LLRQRQNMKGNDSTVQGKTKHTPTGLYELFLLTVSIEEVRRWQYIKQF